MAFCTETPVSSKNVAVSQFLHKIRPLKPSLKNILPPIVQFCRAKKRREITTLLGIHRSNPLRQKSSFTVEEGKNKIKTCYATVSSYVFKRGFPTFWVVEMHSPFENKSCFTLIFSALLLTQLVLGLLEKKVHTTLWRLPPSNTAYYIHSVSTFLFFNAPEVMVKSLFVKLSNV